MQISRALIFIAAWAVLLCCLTIRLPAQGADQFTINIPRKTTTAFRPIREIKAVVALSSPVTAAAPVTFKFTDQAPLSNSTSATCNPNCTFSPHFTPSIPTVPPTDCSMSNIGCFTDNEQGPNSSGPDEIVVYPAGLPGDPARYEMDFFLQSNHGPGNSCANTQQVDPNSYTVTIGSPSANKIIGVCLETFDSGSSASCNNSNIAAREIPIPLANAGDKVATVNTLTQPTLACYKARPAVDVMMVLDKSGSMLTPLTTAQGAFCSGSVDRIGALRCAANRLLELWDPTAGSNPPAILGDRVGIISFSTSASTDAALTAVTPGNNAIKNTINNIPVGGSTSIGAGLHEADPKFAGATNRKVVLLMTDGQQNTDPKVEVTNLATRSAGLYCDNSTDPLCTIPTCISGNSCPLSNNPQIYTVTLGPSTGVPQAIQQEIDNASLGFYLHTDTDGGLLSPFFLELLQNFLKFNSYDTVRMISDKASGTPYSAEVPISTTSHDAEFSLMWPKDLGALRMTVTPPGGAPAIVREDASGFITVVQSLPLPFPFDSMGSWHIEVKAINRAPGMTAVAANAVSIPFDLHIMTDDAGVKSDLSVVPGDYKTGDNIRLRAKLRYFGLPILGLGSRPGDKIFVDLIAPGQGVGDMLSDSTASSISPRLDINAGAEAKLFNAVQNAPLGVIHPPGITLFDDGKSEHGDDVAGDGIYNALYPAVVPGDYNFVISVESTAPNAVRFSRQQLRAAYVRAIPDAGNTMIQTSIVRRDAGNTLSIVMTPRVKPGPGCRLADSKCGRMGPGWANYFWFTAPGETPFKARDNLNGTYTATLAFAGSKPPNVSVHFEDVLAVIGDSVTPDHLPAPLGPGNVLVADVTAEKCFGRSASANVLLFLGAGAFLVGLAVYQPWRRRKQS
jgi:hypothetical protein